ncbi:MAG: isoleucine--tRNA ligase [Bacteroidetes bacterium]|nr:isoleucine--tRNA ligase [Bacteroidota bacterium]
MKRYREYTKADWTAFQQEITEFWEENQIFEQSLKADERPVKVFYEGPPSANGIPGIHHVMARTIKDYLGRYWTMQGYRVERKSGWDTHGLPVELQVEKKLGIRRDDIGERISIEEFNRHCREDVLQYTGKWEELTRLMGYWIDLDRPYVTYHNEYIESVWFLLQKLYQKDLLYKGYTIQPYSPAAGTGLSSHELNQPGTYRQVKDLSMVAQFRLTADATQTLLQNLQFSDGDQGRALFNGLNLQVYALAWTTTPWTLPSNTGLAVGAAIDYVLVSGPNTYTSEEQGFLLALDRLQAYSDKDSLKVWGQIKGSALQDLRYEPLLPYARPLEGDPYRMVVGDFVSTEEGTGLVHLAPSFGADDFKAGRQHNLGSLTLVDRAGRFSEEVQDPEFPLAGYPVKEAFLNDEEKAQWLAVQQKQLAHLIADLRKLLSADDLIALKLKRAGQAFRIEKYEHSYPHCWRTDKPILYYPLDSWFVRTTAFKDRMIELNRTIRWKPESTGTGRFGHWLENLVDWNLSRSRFWGTPLPLWRTEDGQETRCIGSMAELKSAMEEARAAGWPNPNEINDLHRPEVDRIVLVSPSGRPMHREPDLIDVWFDSGAMPYAQNHYPWGSGTEAMATGLPPSFPADFIAEGVDQTRGWFFTLHALAVMLFDSVAFRSVISNGLVLDKDGNKMSKRLANTIDPYLMLNRYGADALRWYMVVNAPPWDNLKFDPKGVEEVQRKFFGTLYNTYQFWALYANLDGFDPQAEPPALEADAEGLHEMDRWILSRLHSLIHEAVTAYEEMEPTRAARAIQEFTDEHLSNWYVRLCRRRFWKDGKSRDKWNAFATLHQCLRTLSQLMAPLAPFYADRLYRDLMGAGSGNAPMSVHLDRMPQADRNKMNLELEQRMQWAQQVCSLALSLRKKAGIRVRQPLQRLGLVPPAGLDTDSLGSMLDLIRNEVNIKEIVWTGTGDLQIQRKLRPQFRRLGPRYPTVIQKLGAALEQISAQEVQGFLDKGLLELRVDDVNCVLEVEDLEVITLDIPGWQTASEGTLTVALDSTLSPSLVLEGTARELVNRIQKIRKDRGYELTDRIHLILEDLPVVQDLVAEHGASMANEVLALDIQQGLPSSREGAEVLDLEGLVIRVFVDKVDNKPA